MKYYDTHSHIADYYYDDEINEYMKQLIEQDIFTNAIGCDIESSIRSVELAKKYPNNIKACVGIHPNDVIKYKDDEHIFEKLEEIVKNNLNSIVAIGEIGLDLHYEKENLELQKLFLSKQIEIAKKYNLPIMYHIRDAFEEFKPFVLENKNYKQLIHCFSSNIDEANFYIENNCMLSISGTITFKKAISLQESVKEVDINKLVAETDSPYLTPVPFRGKKNYPHYVQYVYEEIAKLKNLDNSVVQQTLNNNAINFFGLKK